MSKSKKVWLHPDSGLEGLDGCLRLIVTALLILAFFAFLFCLLGALGFSTFKFFTCTFGGDC